MHFCERNFDEAGVRSRPLKALFVLCDLSLLLRQTSEQPVDGVFETNS